MAIVSSFTSSSSSSSSSSLKRSLLMSAFVATLLLLAQRVSSDLSSDAAECESQLMGLVTCLPYVQATAKAPTPDCCTGLKDVVHKSTKCLCLLIKYRGAPELGLQISVPIALGLPSVCHIPANVSRCPELLKLPPNSEDAKVFEQNGNTTQVKGKSTASPAKGPANNTTKAEKNSGSSNGLRWANGYPRTMSTMVKVVGSILLMAAPFLLSI